MNAQALELTDNAAKKVRQLRDSEGNQDLMLRVYVTGGGCSGFSYGFNFAESQNEDDAEFVNGDVKMLVDSLSYQYLVGSVVDYVEGWKVRVLWYKTQMQPRLVVVVLHSQSKYDLNIFEYQHLKK